MISDNTRYFLFLSFRGTNYHGWQVQPEADTVQRKLDTSLGLILNEPVTTTGAGRTDTGVHALKFCAHFDSKTQGLESDSKFIFRLNRLLPDDISIESIRRVVPEANARFSALSRTYQYFISRIKDPFALKESWYIHGNLDAGAMNDCCKILLNHSDFTSFSRLHSNTRTNLCRIDNAYWTEDEARLIFTIKADRFLRNMVRAIVGTMIDIGRGKSDLSSFEEIINAKDRCRAGKSAPSRGLFLTDIEYPGDIFI